MDRATATSEKTHVAMTSLLAAVCITAIKVVVGVATQSLGILAEAAHSALDLIAAAATWWAVRAADRPADAEHLFGHGKIENLSALFEVLLLLVTCGWIVYSAIKRLLGGQVHVTVGVWSFGVMVLSIVVDYSRSRALRRAAVKHNSQALEADALHFETDIWSSLAVIAGLICVAVGQRWPAAAMLKHGDAIAALAVAVIAASVTLRMGLRTLRALTDAAPPGMEAAVRTAVEAVPGVVDCHSIRVRTAGPRVFIDVHMTVDGGKSVSEAHDMADMAESAVMSVIPNADITIHTEPQASLPGTGPAQAPGAPTPASSDRSQR